MRFALLQTIVFGLILISHQEPTNFNYDNHGTDWLGDCSSQTANKQSPIVLPRLQTSTSKTSYFFADFRSISASATIYNTTIYIKPSDSQEFFGQIYTKTFASQPVPFKAFEIRIRTHSEHRIETKDGFYSLQIQIFLKQLFDSSKNIKLNIGLLFEDNQTYDEDPFIAEIIKNAKNINQSFSMNVDLSHLLSREQLFDFWFYLGSATIPPCTNGKINWIIPRKIYKMKSSQLTFFKNIYPKGNYRDVKPILNNQIGYVKTSPNIELQF